SSSGVVTGVTAGSATITAKATNGVTGTKTITVNAATVAVTGVNITGASTVNAGSSVTYTANISPTNATDKSITWSSSATSVAAISSSGVVTGVKSGTATITAKASNGVIGTKTIKVNATTVSVTGVSINASSTSLYTGNTLTLSATVTPTNATDKSITWSSSNTTVATVSSSGIVTGIKDGIAIITAAANNGVSATITVTVSTYYDDKTYTIDLGNGNTTTVVGHYREDNANLLVQELNAYRAENGLNTLAVTTDLTAFAQTRAVEITYNYSHTRPNGKYVTDGAVINGENCVYGYDVSVVTYVWKNSSGHNSTMLDKDYTKVGIGVFEKKNSDGSYTPYYVQVYQY
ncbi:MAG: Ig-like domain-containing protein, partial [Lactobacillus panisapium]